MEQRLAAAPDRDLSRLRAQLLRGLGDLEGARRGYAALAGDAEAERNLAILSGAALPPDDRTGPVPYVRIENFLGEDRREELRKTVRDAEWLDAATSHADGARVDRDFRIAQEIRDSRAVRAWFLPLVRQAAGPEVLARLGLAAFELGGWEMQVTRHTEGGMLGAHRDRGAVNPRRALSYVYYFHREPRGYSGGDLLLFDEGGQRGADRIAAFTRLTPVDNSLVLFSPDRLHCVTEIRSGPDPLDARWTVNGWMLRNA